MELYKALSIAEMIKAELAPHCIRIEIAGSIRRKKPQVKDIEIVAIPKPYETGLFEDGLASIVNRWEKVKGEMNFGVCKYTQRIIKGVSGNESDDIKLDLFFATPENWGLILAIRTGSADYSHKVLATEWVKRGYKSIDGMLTYNSKPIIVAEEMDLFKRLSLQYVPPEERNL